jgi:GAF domain-containing protein
MSPSAIFWLDLLISSISGTVALALLLLVLSTGLRQRLNQTFGLFAASAALSGFSSAITSLTLSFSIGRPIFWTELASAGVYFVGPALFAFAASYGSIWTNTSGQQTEPSKRNWRTVATTIGFVVGLAMLPMLFSHNIVSQVYLDQSGLYYSELTTLGYAIAVGPLLFEALALLLFWQHRHRLGGTSLAASTAILLIGRLLGTLVPIPFPIISFTFAIGLMVMGYAMTNRQIFNPLRTLTGQLESQVAQRTLELQQARDKLQRLNEQQQKVAEINREVAQAATPVEMLHTLVELIHNRLGHHHIYVYQPDESHQYLVIQAAAGTTARTVMERKHQIQIGGLCLAGQVAVENRPRLATAEGDDAVYFGDTALPSARAEIALPLLVGNRLLGVLDIQSIYADAFSDQDLNVLASLAAQVAVTLDHARLLQQREAALAELGKVQQQYLRQAWQSTLGRQADAPAYVYAAGDGVKATSLHTAASPEIAQATRESQALVSGEQDNPATTLTLPIFLRNQIIGALQLQHKPGRAWQPDDIDTLGNITERLGPALETARLSEEAQRRVAHERFIREISDRMQRATDMKSLMRITAEELNTVLSASRTYVRLGTAAQLTGGDEAEV